MRSEAVTVVLFPAGEVNGSVATPPTAALCFGAAAVEEPMQRLAEVGRGDPDAVHDRLDLNLAQRRDQEKS